MVTCSREKHADLFRAVLGGLGQFGIITRARIPLFPAPARARYVRLVYAVAAALTADQERLIAVDGAGEVLAGIMSYVEGSVLTDYQGLIGSWRSSSFFTKADEARLAELAKEAGGVLYCLEGAVYYGGAGDTSAQDADKVNDETDDPAYLFFFLLLLYCPRVLVDAYAYGQSIFNTRSVTAATTTTVSTFWAGHHVTRTHACVHASNSKRCELVGLERAASTSYLAWLCRSSGVVRPSLAKLEHTNFSRYHSIDETHPRATTREPVP